MGLCYSINREYRILKNLEADTVEKRTFAGLACLVKLKSIYDGDTFRIIARKSNKEPYHEYSLRLAGLDAPEVKPSYDTPDCALHKLAGITVRNHLMEKYPPGTILWVEFDKEEKYGRLLGTVWSTKPTWFGFGPVVKDKNLCDYLIAQEYALPYLGGKKNVFTKDYLEEILKSVKPN